VQVRGSITYNGETFDSFQVARTSAYISQDDNHQAELTVRETLDFAARCLGVGHKQGEHSGWLLHGAAFSMALAAFRPLLPAAGRVSDMV
jgi:ABC-type transport system involved in cytochrome c biogenesis ATPase subunit